MTHVDTAEMYGTGEAEKIVGEAIEGRRDEAFLVSKVLPSNASFEGTVAACERTLKRLRTDRLELYLLHWRGPTPLAETIRAFDVLVREGRIRAWGVSNFDVADLDEALAIAGPGKIACNQVLYHLNERAIEHAVIPWCERNRVAVVAYSPLGAGEFPLSSKVLADVGRAHGIGPHAVALAFLTRHGSLFAIPKSARPEHVEVDAAAGDLMLAHEEVARLEDAFPRGRRRPLPTL
jgi:diketogulonate reductase-like aldo/keto reductase